MHKTPDIGDLIRVVGSNQTFTGAVRFATKSFISVDEGGGVTAILKLDASTDSWRFGKESVTWTVTATTANFLLRLQAVLAKVVAARGLR